MCRGIFPTIFDYYSDELTAYDLFGGTQTNESVSVDLTVHAQVQKAAQDALAGRKGSIGVYNYQTGEIICMVSGPTFDPRNPSEVDDSGAYDGVYVNRFLHSSYTPGSIFKLVTSAAAIGQLDDLDSKVFNCTGSWTVNHEVINCNSVHGEINYDTALAKSCNIAFAQLAVELGPEILLQYAQDAGIEQQLYFDGFRTAAGNVDLENVPSNSLAWAGVGQSTDQINPCQYMVYVGAIANGGVAAKPYVVSSIHCGEEETYHAETTMCEPMLREEVAARLEKAMHGAVVNTYGEHNFAGLYVGAKTGTAQRGGDLASNSLFVGYVKNEAMPLAFIVIVEDGGSGSRTCVPIIRQVLNACVTALGTE